MALSKAISELISGISPEKRQSLIDMIDKAIGAGKAASKAGASFADTVTSSTDKIQTLEEKKGQRINPPATPTAQEAKALGDIAKAEKKDGEKRKAEMNNILGEDSIYASADKKSKTPLKKADKQASQKDETFLDKAGKVVDNVVDKAEGVVQGVNTAMNGINRAVADTAVMLSTPDSEFGKRAREYRKAVEFATDLGHEKDLAYYVGSLAGILGQAIALGGGMAIQPLLSSTEAMSFMITGLNALGANISIVTSPDGLNGYNKEEMEKNIQQGIDNIVNKIKSGELDEKKLLNFFPQENKAQDDDLYL